MFNDYQSRPVTRRAHEITESDEILKRDAESTSAIEVDGKVVEFKHYEPVWSGDFIVYLNDDDIYHCNRDVFLERNIVE